MADAFVTNAGWYLVMAPGAVLSPDGQAMYAVAGMHDDVHKAFGQAASIPGAAVILNVCLFVNRPQVAPAAAAPRLVAAERA